MEDNKTVAFCGSGSGKKGEVVYGAMSETAAILAMRGIHIYTGAYGGSGMEAPALGATEAGGTCTGFTLWGMPGNDFLTKQVNCDTLQQFLLSRKNAINSNTKLSDEVAFGARLGHLLEADDFVFGAEGSQGTGVEFLTYVNLMAKRWLKNGIEKRAALLCPPDSKGPWGETMLSTFRGWGWLPQEVEPFIRVVETPLRAADWVMRSFHQ
ncbi:MAG: hypothetical protein ABI430_02490 [Candidatus Taylorbacteria bacterium]